MSDTMMGQVRTWSCPKCRWYRSWTDTAAWKAREIDHPLYGKIKGGELAEKDIAEHQRWYCPMPMHSVPGESPFPPRKETRATRAA